MSKETQVAHMIDAIVKIEHDFISDRLNTDSVAKKNAVKAILDEVERITEDENQDD